jgi:hypothetical protein
MPRGSRIVPLASALTSAKSAAYVGGQDCLRQCVHVHLSFVPANLTCRDHGANAVLAHVAQLMGGPGFSRATIINAHDMCEVRVDDLCSWFVQILAKAFPAFAIAAIPTHSEQSCEFHLGAVPRRAGDLFRQASASKTWVSNVNSRLPRVLLCLVIT